MTLQPQYIITKEDYDQIYCIQYPLTSEERRRICEHSRPAPPVTNIRKAIKELEYSLSVDPQEEIDCHIREAIALLKERDVP